MAPPPIPPSPFESDPKRQTVFEMAFNMYETLLREANIVSRSDAEREADLQELYKIADEIVTKSLPLYTLHEYVRALVKTIIEEERAKRYAEEKRRRMSEEELREYGVEEETQPKKKQLEAKEMGKEEKKEEGGEARPPSRKKKRRRLEEEEEEEERLIKKLTPLIRELTTSIIKTLEEQRAQELKELKETVIKLREDVFKEIRKGGRRRGGGRGRTMEEEGEEEFETVEVTWENLDDVIDKFTGTYAVRITVVDKVTNEVYESFVVTFKYAKHELPKILIQWGDKARVFMQETREGTW